MCIQSYRIHSKNSTSHTSIIIQSQNVVYEPHSHWSLHLWIKADSVRDAYHRAPLFPTPGANSQSGYQALTFNHHVQEEEVRRPTRPLIVREQSVGEQSRWRRRSRNTPVRQNSVHRVTDYYWNRSRSTHSRPRWTHTHTHTILNTYTKHLSFLCIACMYNHYILSQIVSICRWIQDQQRSMDQWLSMI